MEFLLAVQFLTRVNINIKGIVKEKNMARAMAYFPLVGLLLGVGAAALYYLVSTLTTAIVGDIFAIAFIIIITGNMHFDGLMDTADGIYSCRDKEGILEIMKDSRVGAHGVATGILAILIRFTLLSQIPLGAPKLMTLAIIPVLGRWTQVYGAVLYPYARTSGGKANFIDEVGKRELIWATITTLATLVLLFILVLGSHKGVLESIFMASVSLIGAAVILRYLAKKIQGITGDLLGAATELTELWSLFILLTILK